MNYQNSVSVLSASAMQQMKTENTNVAWSWVEAMNWYCIRFLTRGLICFKGGWTRTWQAPCQKKILITLVSNARIFIRHADIDEIKGPKALLHVRINHIADTKLKRYSELVEGLHQSGGLEWLPLSSADSPLGPKIPKGNDGCDLACTTTYIYVIGRLGGPCREKLWPRSSKGCPRPQVTVFPYTDRP